MTDEAKGEKKIIIDEDWKSRVEAEREAAKKPQPEGETVASDGAASETGSMVWPEPSLPLLVTTLATQAMAAMGLIAEPGAGQPARDLPQAKHFIDTIGMLEEKTKGNCSAEEADMFDSVLYELRMAFVAVKEKFPAK